MQKRRTKWRTWWRVSAIAVGATLFQGCAIDPDIILRAELASASDLAIFLLQNLAAGL